MLNSFVFKYLMGCEQYEKQKSSVFNHLMGSFSKIENLFSFPSE